MIIPILASVIAAALLILFLMLVVPRIRKRDAKRSDVEQRIQKKGKSAILKEAQKKLQHDPHNVPALEIMGDIYYKDKNWEKAWTVYKTLYDIATAHVEIDVAKAALRMGVSAYNLKKLDDAAGSLMISVKRDPENFEANLYLGKTFFEQKIYDKSLYCLKKARTLNPESKEIIATIGMCFFNLHKYKECLPFLKKVLDENPDNKEILYDMAVAMAETGMGDKALKVFIHLRPDPVFGANSCLEAGKMHERSKDFKSAVQDYTIGIKLDNVPEQTAIQIRYRCANCLLQMNDISNALAHLKQIQNMKPGYKDVDALVARYSELNQNKNLQTYLMSGTSDFVALSRKLISTYHADAFVKVEDVQVGSECVEVICNVENPKWESKEIFRFYRNQTVIGDIYIREFHSKIRDSKCDKGVCATIGSFSESCHKYIEGRPIDLIEKEALSKLLKKVSVLG